MFVIQIFALEVAPSALFCPSPPWIAPTRKNPGHGPATTSAIAFSGYKAMGWP